MVMCLCAKEGYDVYMGVNRGGCFAVSCATLLYNRVARGGTKERFRKTSSVLPNLASRVPDRSVLSLVLIGK